MNRLSLLLLLQVLLAPVAAGGADSPALGDALLRTGWALLLVIGLILALYALSKKRLLPGTNRGSAISVLEVRPVAAKATLALVEVRGREYLLGIGDGGIRLLAEFDSQPPASAPPDFAAMLAKQS